LTEFLGRRFELRSNEAPGLNVDLCLAVRWSRCGFAFAPAYGSEVRRFAAGSFRGAESPTLNPEWRMDAGLRLPLNPEERMD
jgi:hypothetical protein